MSETTTDNAVAQHINDFEHLYARQTGFNEYRVLNTSGDDPTAYEVDLAAMSCTCGDYTYNKDGQHEICKHLAYALYQAPRKRQAEEHTVRQIASVTMELSQAVRDLQGQTNGMQTTSQTSAGSQTASGDDDSDSSDEDDSDGELTEIDATGDQQDILDELDSWFTQAAGFNGFDPSIVSLSWARSADGTEGVIVERSPFDGGYYDDGQWQDQESFNEEKEAMKDSVLTPNDAFEWYGEPDYAYFISETDAQELVA